MYGVIGVMIMMTLRGGGVMGVHVGMSWMGIVSSVIMGVMGGVYVVSRNERSMEWMERIREESRKYVGMSIITGMIWSKEVWGEWWINDVRNISMLVCWIWIEVIGGVKKEYKGIIGWMGMINMPIIKYGVEWWNTMHQPVSVSEWGGSIGREEVREIVKVIMIGIMVSIEVSKDMRKREANTGKL
uniref:C1 cytochrome ABC transporter subunit n=1 Tax=Galdieria sulphuraria TaxID=130081 RepID=A0A075W3W5_GALSU|nr:c1 cytochrome ABC transporter subunit [Galdieria sulphuraria]AIG92655.1 c1 cytochrome ABC transporter subunit [Galdieria sulphuraria]